MSAAEMMSRVLARSPHGGYVVVRVEAVHAYECPYWRMGRRHAACNCGAREVWSAKATLAEALINAADPASTTAADAASKKEVSDA